MAVASAVGKRGDLALAKDPQFRFCRRRHASRARAVGSRLARRTADGACRAVDRAGRPAHGVPLPRAAPWPRLSELPPENAAVTLPVPAQSVFEIPEGLRAAREALHPRTARSKPDQASMKRMQSGFGRTRNSRRVTRGRLRVGHGPGSDRRHGASKAAGTQPRPQPAQRGPLKHLVQVRKRRNV